MTATLRLLSCSDARSQRDHLLALAHQRARSAPGSVLCLAPTARAAAEFQQRLFEVHRGSVGVRLTTFFGLAAAVLEDEGLPSHPLSAGQRRLIAEEMVADLSSRGELHYYGRVRETAGFADGLLGMIGELSRAGIRATAFARAVYRRQPESPKQARNKDRECARFYARYQRELHRRGQYDEDGVEALAAGFAAGSQCPLLEGVEQIFVIGFSALGPAQQTFLNACAERVCEVWVGLLDEPEDLRAELFTRPRVFRQRLGPAEIQTDPPSVPGRPAGIAHLAEQLFRPLRQVRISSDATGLSVIEAPGLAGEVRLVARRIKELLLEGASPGDILVTARDITPYVDLWRELGAEFGLPLEIEGNEPLGRHPLVALLLRAVRLEEDDFPFAGVTALLRHTAFRPAWPGFEEQTDQATRAEALLRLLGESRGREAYLDATARWAECEQPGLEDEAAEESRRKLTHELAKQCHGFLERFFRCWDGAPLRAPLGEHLAWLARFAEDLGLVRAAQDHEESETAWATLWSEIRTWQGRSGAQVLDRRSFLRRLQALASQAGLPRSGSGPGRVRILGAEEAQYLSCSHRFILGLGERGFPRSGGEPSLFSGADREAFNRAGLDLPISGQRSDEMLLFYRLVADTEGSLTFSYPAVDERGQELLPSSFLLAALECFPPNSVPVERRNMLIEQLTKDRPLSAAEYRVRVGLAWPAGSGTLAPGLGECLTDAAGLIEARFHEREFTPYDGRFTDRFLIGWVGRLFGPQRVFSPTALEDYIACPFRFFLRHVLHLEPLEEPREQIEVTRKGMTYHRALARLHTRMRDQGTHAPTRSFEDEVQAEMRRAIDEDVIRAPGPASKVLWRLEGQRLLRSAGKYPAQWGKFVQPWNAAGIAPRPHFFEVDFGMPAAEGQPAFGPLVLSDDGVEVRLWGRIDRVDLADTEDGLGFWIIDYKTGRASNYTATDLSNFRKVQLTLYAAAVEAVLLAGQQARPLGLAYWLVSDTGAKVVLPGRNATAWLEQKQRWPAIREQLVRWVTSLARRIRQGDFSLAPRSEHCTQTCPFGSVCRISQARAVGKVFQLPLPGEGAEA